MADVIKDGFPSNKKYCNHIGCDFSSNSEQGINVHKFRIHTPRGRKAAKAAAKNFGRRTTRKADRVTSNGLPEDYDPSASAETLQRAAKRAAKREEVHFCPKCGCNIDAVSIAMGFSE